MVIGPEGIKMEKEKVRGELECPTPKSVKDIQKFLGLANYYHQFIQDFASIARLLHDCHIQVHLSGNNVPAVKPPLNHTSLPSMVATFLTTYLMAVLQPSRYSVFHGGDTPIQLSLL